MTAMSPAEADAARKAAENERKKQVVINAAHRLSANEDFQAVSQFLHQLFGLEQPAFLAKPGGGYDPLWAAIRDGQRSVFLQIDHLTKLPCKGDANVEQKPKVKR